MAVDGHLLPDDVAMFARIGVDEALVRAAQVGRLTSKEARAYGFSLRDRPTANLSGLVFPYHDPETGCRVTARLRRDKPEVDSDGKPQNKYLCPWGDNRHLYFPPGAGALLSDVTAPTVVVEAEKSALAITALASRCGRRFLAVATGGCWGWRGKAGIEPGPNGEREEVRGPLPDLNRITWKDRKAIILFDSNVASNSKVRAARNAFAEALRERGAKVYLANLPEE